MIFFNLDEEKTIERWIDRWREREREILVVVEMGRLTSFGSTIDGRQWRRVSPIFHLRSREHVRGKRRRAKQILQEDLFIGERESSIEENGALKEQVHGSSSSNTYEEKNLVSFSEN